MSSVQILQADWTWSGDRFQSGVQIGIDQRGRIVEVGRGQTPTQRLTGTALLPGFVNAHSHAFQRGLRGHGERFPAGAGNFWSWREAMYGLVETMDSETLWQLCVQAYGEMLEAGITTVGEFHYLHHATDQAGYEFDRVVLHAAAEAGIRIVLLNAYYATGGIGQPLSGAQRRFGSTDADSYWKQMDMLESILDATKQSLGVVAHSIRAATIEDISSLHTESRRRGLPFHMHIEEQRREIEECLRGYGRRPMQILNDALQIDDNLTAVHCTHTEPEDLARFLRAGGTICVCPLTEANLGDGLPSLTPMTQLRDSLSLGSDSNARISMLEEMRWLEYGQRLRRETRGALADSEGHVARTVLRAATAGGARALGLPVGRLEAGFLADIAVINLEHPALAGCVGDQLLEALVCGTDNEVVLGTYVGGKWRERRGTSSLKSSAGPQQQRSTAVGDMLQF